MLRKITVPLAAIALASVGLITTAPTTSAIGAPTPSAKTTPTPYALGASGYASRVIGGDLPVGSDRSGMAVIGCTNKAGLNNANSEATADISSGMAATTTKTRVWTTKKGDKVSSWSRHTIERVTLADTPLGSLYLKGLVSTSHAWHDSSGFHAESTSKLGGIVLDPAIGPSTTVPVPNVGDSVPIAGVGIIKLGERNGKTSAHGASTAIDAVRFNNQLTHTVTYLAHSRATISDGVVSATYGGQAFATRSSVLDGILTGGRSAVTIVPCLGSDGEWTTSSLADADVSEGGTATGLTSRQRSGLTNKGQPEVTSIGRVTAVNLGGGLIVRVVKAKAHVAKTTHGYVRDIKGTTVGKVIYGGEEQPLPDTGVYQIPGVAEFEQAIVQRGTRSISVVALRITLLDGSLAVIDLGYAKASLKPTGMP